MSSFLEKLKKGMGVKEVPIEKELEEPEKKEEKLKPAKEKKPARKTPTERKKIKKPEPEPELKKEEYIEEEKPLPRPQKKEIKIKKVIKEQQIEMPKEEKKKIEVKNTSPLVPEEKERTEKSLEIERKEEKSWFESEGQLAVDVYQTDGEIVIQSAVAGVKPEELDISIENDVVIIRGRREKPTEKEEKNYFYQECYWGRFSREIILPAEVDGGRCSASMKEGVLTIRIPKIEREKKRKILVKE